MNDQPHARPAGASLLRTRIKICGLTREADVDAVVEAGADAVGFVLYPPSPRHVHAARAGELARRLPPFLTPVLLVVNASAADIAQALDQVPNATLQFHGDETPAQCDALARGRPYLRAARIPLGPDGRAFNLVKYAQDYPAAQAILLDAHVEGNGGGGLSFEWSLLPPNVDSPLVLSGGLTPANVGDGIRQVRPRCKSLAVDVSSGVEAAKGLKDAVKIQQFVAAVRAADALLQS